MKSDLKVLVIDNFDSFTYNLVDEFAKRKCQVRIYRNNIPLDVMKKIVEEYDPHLIVLSPGPGNPKQAGICVPLIQEFMGKIPMLGVCLGHQAIIEALGGEVDKAPEVVHGKTSLVYHNSEGLFNNVPNPFIVARYHSLCAVKTPKSLEIIAQTRGGIVMAIRSKNKEVFLEGLQFHPESVMTTHGGKIIENLIENIIKKIKVN
ncbi:aminodeoxychorismate/anthranilate synthase component II [Candidatus Woesearchaeota archaeon]|nr:aminodeoxychorismate/anthranilate synthase component II [Candidatus Woesearchaeota archaeon]